MLGIVGGRFGEGEVGVEVVGSLGKYTCPIYRVYGAEIEGAVDFGIGKKGLDCILHVVSIGVIGTCGDLLGSRQRYLLQPNCAHLRQGPWSSELLV